MSPLFTDKVSFFIGGCIGLSFVALGIRFVIWLFEKYVLRRPLIHDQNRFLIYTMAFGAISFCSLFVVCLKYYPTDTSIAQSWNIRTPENFPEHYEMISKVETPGGFIGDYSGAYLLKLDKADYLKLKQQLSVLQKDSNESWNNSAPLIEVLQNNDLTLADFDLKVSGFYAESIVAFMDKDNLVLFAVHAY